MQRLGYGRFVLYFGGGGGALVDGLITPPTAHAKPTMECMGSREGVCLGMTALLFFFFLWNQSLRAVLAVFDGARRDTKMMEL